jgi:hypothetical protein
VYAVPARKYFYKYALKSRDVLLETAIEYCNEPTC